MIAYWLFIFLIVNNSIGNNRIRVFLQYIFMLTALGFYYYHMLKYECAKAFDDVSLDLWIEVLAIPKRHVSNARHAVWYVDAGQRFSHSIYN